MIIKNRKLAFFSVSFFAINLPSSKRKKKKKKFLAQDSLKECALHLVVKPI
jgi:hypothetical protein